MAALKNPKHEAIAQGLAAGLSMTKALEAAEYVAGGDNWKLCAREDVTARVKALRDAASWGAGPDPASQKLAELARRSADLGTAVGLLGAGKLVVEIAKRRDRLQDAEAHARAKTPELNPAAKAAPAVVFMPLPQLSDEEWKAKYGR